MFKYKLSKGTYYFFAERSSILENYLGKYSFTISVTEWQKDSIGWWYGDDSGWYAKNETIKIDGKNYNFNASGYCTNP